MRHLFLTRLVGMALIATMFITIAYAQGQRFRPQNGFAQGDRRGGPPMGGSRPGGPPPSVTAAGLPISVLDAGLHLTSGQAAQITRLRQPFRPPFGGPGGGGPGRPGGLDSAADQKIMALLTAAQKQALPGLLAKANALRADGIPLQVWGELKLTPAQQGQLLALGQAAEQARKTQMAKQGQGFRPGPNGDPMRGAWEQTHAKAIALLSNSQRILVEQFQDAHPGGPGGGPGGGGFGPPPGGGPGGGPQNWDGPPPPGGP